jgi:hypothetical protein
MKRQITRKHSGRRADDPERIRSAIHDLSDQIMKNSRDLQLQFQRISQIQAELDAIRKAWNERGFPDYPESRKTLVQRSHWPPNG